MVRESCFARFYWRSTTNLRVLNLFFRITACSRPAASRGRLLCYKTSRKVIEEHICAFAASKWRHLAVVNCYTSTCRFQANPLPPIQKVIESSRQCAVGGSKGVFSPVDVLKLAVSYIAFQIFALAFNLWSQIRQNLQPTSHHSALKLPFLLQLHRIHLVGLKKFTMVLPNCWFPCH